MPTKQFHPDRSPGGSAVPGAGAWSDDPLGVLVVAAYAVLALLGGLIAAGDLLPGVTAGTWDAGYYRSNPLAFPPQLFLYASLGALTYVFTALAARPGVGTARVLRLGVRLPVAVVVVVPVYVLLVPVFGVVRFPTEPAGVRGLAGLAFLVGLFVEHATVGVLTVVYKRLSRWVVRGGRGRLLRGG